MIKYDIVESHIPVLAAYEFKMYAKLNVAGSIQITEESLAMDGEAMKAHALANLKKGCIKALYEAAKEAYDKEFGGSYAPPGSAAEASGGMKIKSSGTGGSLNKGTKLTSYEYPVIDELRKHFEGIDAEVDCPSCAGGKERLWDVIIHLNDYHKFSREYIANWVDRLDIEGLKKEFTYGNND